MWCKFGLLAVLFLLGACATVQVKSTSDQLALTEIALTETAVQVKLLKDQGILVRDSAQQADVMLIEASNALDAAWLALGDRNEHKALMLLSIAQGINNRLIQYLKQKEKPDDTSSIRERTGGGVSRLASIRWDGAALQYAEGESRSGGQNGVQRSGDRGTAGRTEGGGRSCAGSWRGLNQAA
jgi:hypothetical protein